MFKINRKVEYALMALKYMRTQKGRLVTVKELSRSLKTPFDSTSQVMQTLAKNDLIESLQGKNGGYQLSPKIEELSFLELSQLIEKREFYQNCESRGCSHLEDCCIKEPITKLHDKLKGIFEKISVLQLLDEGASIE